jgi:signal transduction histidine kinase
VRYGTASADRVARLIATAVGALALLTLVGGWLLDIEALRTLGFQWSPMAPLTALFMLMVSCGIFWFEQHRRLSNVLLLLAFVMAAGVLMHYLLDLELGLSRLNTLFRSNRRSPIPELPAPDTAAAVMMLALALACLRTDSRNLHEFADVVATAVVIVCAQVLIGFTYSVGQATMHGFRHIAPHSTLSVLLLACAVITRRPSAGTFASLVGPEQSSWLLRRLVPITVVLCVLIGWLHLRALQHGVGGSVAESVAWTVTGAVVLLSMVLFVTGGEMRKIEANVRRRQEELIAATRAAEAASDAKSRFMGVMSHELRTPLTQMIGYADLLDAGLAGELSEVGKTYTHRMRASGWHLAGLIDAVLFYTGGKLPAQHDVTSNLDVHQLVAEVVGMFRAQAQDKSLMLEFEAPTDPVFVDVDERNLRQILINLISNAVKFTEQGSIIVSLRSSPDTVRIEVRDTGIGIAGEDLVRIWEPFQALDASHTRTQGGMGLGLALTRQLVEQMGAHINAASTAGSGATFSVELPKTVHRERTTLQLNGVNILVVDDEPTVRKIMARTLARHGALVSEADSVIEALKQIAQKRPDVLVTDISMPGMTGIQLGEQLQAQRVDVPVLFVTGAELDARDEASIAALGARLLKKPFDMFELARAVQILVRKN